MTLEASTTMAPANLTPAIDKFVRLPTGPNIDPYFMTAAGPIPQGPEPFQLVAAELQPLSDYVKEMVVSENPVLTMAASHFFEKVRLSCGFDFEDLRDDHDERPITEYDKERFDNIDTVLSQIITLNSS